MTNKLLHIMTMKERLFVGDLVHEHVRDSLSSSYSWETNVWPQ